MPITIDGSSGISDLNGSATTPLYRGNSSNTGIYFGVDTILFAEGGVQAAEINSSGNLRLVNNLSVGNTAPSTSGSGITFPATQSASSNANTLDDYEEGTFTPTVAFGGGTTGITYATQVGYYTKIGNFVWITLSVTLSNKGSSSGNFQILGLPFNIGQNVIPSMRMSSTTFGGQYTAVSQTTQFELQETSEAGTLSTITNSDATNSSQIILTCVHNV